MIHDLSEAGAPDRVECDVCIVGSGPAGTTVASELRDSGLRVCVLESGKRKTTAYGDALRAVVSEGIAIKEYSRERVLGGASTTWAGLSSPLDRIDMEPRPWLRRIDAAQTGWPLAREELFADYARAAERYRFPRLSLFELGGRAGAAGGFGALKAGGDLRPTWERVDEKVFLAAAEPQNFGREHRHVFEGEGVDLYLDATVLRLEGGGEGGGARPRVARAVCRASNGREVAVHARTFVLACGGIENARLLLVSRDLCPDGLGNERDQVGRCLMNHPKNYFGVIQLAKPVRQLPYYFGCLFEGYAGYAGLRLSEQEQRERGLLNSYVRLEPLFPWTDNRGVESLVLLVKRSKFLFERWKQRRRGQVVELRDYSETGDDSDFMNQRKSPLEWLGLGLSILWNAPRVAQYAYFRLFDKKSPSIRAARVRNFMEMEPDPENRVLLSNERDANGQPLPLVRHRCTELDRRSLLALHEALARELPAAGFGELAGELANADPWPITQDASHHMGTTRMGTDPAASVVDPSCRLHSVENVYLAGASVFPTSGCANPTFTLVALAIRLARHLREEVFAAPAATQETA